MLVHERQSTRGCQHWGAFREGRAMGKAGQEGQQAPGCLHQHRICHERPTRLSFPYISGVSIFPGARNLAPTGQAHTWHLKHLQTQSEIAFMGKPRHPHPCGQARRDACIQKVGFGGQRRRTPIFAQAALRHTRTVRGI